MGRLSEMKGFHAGVEESIPLSHLNNSKPLPFLKEQLYHLYKLISQANCNASGSYSIAQTNNAHTTLHDHYGSKTSWVIDSGVSHHISSNSRVFIYYNPCYRNLKVKIANGSMSSVPGERTIQISKDLFLHSILHVPNLSCIH